jgi:hypothetical protein
LAVFLSTCTTCWGDSDQGGKPLEKWGYALIESVKSESQKRYLESAIKSLNVLSITGYKLGSGNLSFDVEPGL